MAAPPALPVHNQTASVANLARMVLGSIDRKREVSTVQTASLVLMLETLIELAEPRAEAVREAQVRSVRQLVAQVETAVRDRDDDQRQERGEKSPSRRVWG
jgi:hypothetical protein